MVSPTLGLLRGLRAASLGLMSFVLALVAHVAAGGAAPGPLVLLVLAGLTGLAALLLTGVRLSPVRVGVSLTAMQVVLHEAFMWLGARAGCVMTGMGTPGGGHLGHTGQPMFACAADMARPGMGQHSVFASSAMVCTHIAATAVMAALLAYGEKVLWFLASWVRLVQWSRLESPGLPALRVLSSDAPRVLQVRFASGGLGLRGPPSPSLFATI